MRRQRFSRFDFFQLFLVLSNRIYHRKNEMALNGISYSMRSKIDSTFLLK